MLGADFGPVLYADDIVLISEDEDARNNFLGLIEEEGASLGLRLNKNKCELLIGGTALPDRPICFPDCFTLAPVTEAKYLGCFLNYKTAGALEPNKRIAACMTILKRLDNFWLYSNCDIRRKLLVFNAVLRSKLLYGIESLHLTQASIRAIDTFHKTGIRKILGWLTTYGQILEGAERTNNNEELYKIANYRLCFDAPATAPLVPLSENHKHQSFSQLVKLILADSSDPRRMVTFADDKFAMHA